MCNLKQKNYLKYNRIFEKNKYLNINFDKVETLYPDNYFNKSISNLFSSISLIILL